MTAAPQLQLVQGERGELELNTALVRRFLGIAPEEFIELTAFVYGRPHVAQCNTEGDQSRLLREADAIRGFNGSYMLVNGPLDPALGARYEPNRWDSGWNGRATDRDVGLLRAVFLDVDPIRPKGISATEEQRSAALEVALSVEDWLARELGGSGPIGHGCSGNGYFILIALDQLAPSVETTRRISRFLDVLQKRFGTEMVKIDRAVANPARLMPAPGTWKRKGRNTPERPHRMTSFVCAPEVRRVPLEALA